MNTIRQAAVAGTFYEASKESLVRDVRDLLSQVKEPAEGTPCPKALIVPHAGYLYSGSTAAAAYITLRRHAAVITRVVLLGPVHRVPVNGLALPDAQAFATPLGVIEIDQDAVRSLAGLPQVVVSGAAHQAEHSLEVQLPFLQNVLGSFKLVPLAVGNASNGQVAEVLNRLWGGPETVIVISSDLSHFHKYDQARQIDQETVQRILHGVPLYTYDQACGATPINGMILAAKQHGLIPSLVGFCNSGDKVANRDSVVGYASFTYTDPSTAKDVPLDDAVERGKIMLSIARASISTALGNPCTADESAGWLQERGAVFVTLHKNGKLRGCIGSFTPYRRLLEDIKANARAAAQLDRRFQPVTLAELPELQIEVSQLFQHKPLTFSSEADAIGQLQGGVDGLIFEFNQHRSTFLPQVWEQLPDPRQFMAQLKIKAGLPQDFWSESIRLLRYRVHKWAEKPASGG
ncbi:MAG: AmmeMemoRadiSam system protein B [Chlorobiaceae bacterium]|nr:AmmeMemoRadiSam system protein B [Chlorobiaceae bacterium]